MDVKSLLDMSDTVVDSADDKKNTKKRKMKTSEENKNVKKSKKNRSDVNFKGSEIKFNLFNSEVANLLSEMNVKSKYKKLFEEWLQKFKDFTQAMQEFEDIRLSELVPRKKASSKNKFINELISNYKCNFITDSDTWIKCIRPEGCFSSCLYNLNCLVGPELCVDVNVIIPSKCFLSKDYVNNSWVIKCYCYLTYLYTQLIKTDLCSDVTFDCSKEILTVTPSESKKILVKIHVIPEQDTFKLARFEPDKNNIKKSLCLPFGEVDEALRDHPTPYFNSLALQKLTLQTNCEFIEQKLAGLTTVLDGVKLLSIWLKNRHLLGTQYGFTEELLTHTVCHLISMEKITNLMSVHQVLRAFWYYISTSDWIKEPIITHNQVSTEKLTLYRENFDIVFFDMNGNYNLAAFLLPNVYLKIKSEAELALKWLDCPNMDSFWPLFMIKMPLYLQYDGIIRLDDSEMFENVYRSIAVEESFKMMGCFRSLITKHILQILSRGLTKRILHLVPLFDDNCKENERFETLLFGVTLDDTKAFSIVEKGPAGDSPEAADFRNFWGNLSELRRFADSTIKEAVHFSTKTTKEKRGIFKKIVDYVVKEKLKIEKCRIVCDEFEEVLLPKNDVAPFHIGTCEEASSKVINTLMDLDKILRSFTLPLEITGIQGSCETFGYTNVFSPVPTNYQSGKKLTNVRDDNIILKDKITAVPKYIEPLDCVIQLNLNSKWPDEVEAIRKIKCAFFLELSKLLKKLNILSNCNMENINVLYKGLVFRFRLYHPKEVSILRKYVKPDGIIAFKDTEESLRLVKDLFILPKMISAIYGVHSQFPSYGPSTCLIKRWLRSQLIDDFYIPDMVIDLLNASLYLNNEPYSTAVLPQVAFMRFLKHYGEFNFNVQCVTVNFNDELTTEQVKAFENEFRRTRVKFPPMYIVTLDDEGKSIFTQNCEKEIVRRFCILCKSAYETINDGILQETFNLKDLFVPNMEGYNFLIQLKPLFNARRQQVLNFENSSESVVALSKFEIKEDNKIPVIGFDPVQLYLKELRKNYGEFIHFFHDSYGGNVIGGLWNPTALQQRDFKASFINGTHLVDNKLVLNKQSIIEDCSFTIGQGLVAAVDFF